MHLYAIHPDGTIHELGYQTDLRLAKEEYKKWTNPEALVLTEGQYKRLRNNLIDRDTLICEHSLHRGLPVEISQKWLKDQIKLGNIPFLKVGNRRLFNLHTVYKAIVSMADTEKDIRQIGTQ